MAQRVAQLENKKGKNNKKERTFKFIDITETEKEHDSWGEYEHFWFEKIWKFWK